MSWKHAGLVSAIALMAALGSTPVAASSTPDDDDAAVGAIVVTGSLRVRQGGAQDIGHFRGEAERKQIPFPDSITPEGLMGPYDLQIGAAADCTRLFCLTTEAMRAGLAGKPDDRLFVGLGFNTNIDARDWSRAPLNLVAVVDKSGSMSGQPLDLVRKSLRQVVSQLRPGDQISIVLYGDTSHVHLAPTPFTAASKAEILKSIDGIQSAGSTFMEAGLKVGYETAFASQEAFKGSTRLMLFTDEQPNVGRTDAASFIGMALEASRRNVGLTTIGVGVQFDAALATRVSSTRGGNLFFVRDEAGAKAVFEAKLDTMVSELAHDLRIELKPHPGYRVSAVYGVPGEILSELPEGAVAITVPTAFLSTEGGGVFFTLAKVSAAEFLPEPAAPPGSALAQVSLSYITAKDGSAMRDTTTVAVPADTRPGDGLQLAHTLVDEFLALRQGTEQFHAGDEEAAYQTFRALSARLESNPDARLEPERDLARQLLAQTAFLSGNSDEAPPGVRAMAVVGEWEVTRINGEIDLARGDRLLLDDGDWAEVVRKRGQRPDDEGESYAVNDTQLLLADSRITFNYEVARDRLILIERRSGVRVEMKRVAALEE